MKQSFYCHKLSGVAVRQKPCSSNNDRSHSIYTWLKDIFRNFHTQTATGVFDSSSNGPNQSLTQFTANKRNQPEGVIV